MKKQVQLSVLSIGILFLFSGASLEPIEPQSSFFDQESVLEVKMKGDWKALMKDAGDKPEYHEMEFSYQDAAGKWQSTPIKAKVRGNFRRQNCSFPPIKLNFKAKQLQGTELEGLDKVKLVHPCHKQDKFNDYILNEYLSYKSYRALTDTSFRVRLLHITYEGMENKNGPVQRWAFMIEPVEMLAARIKGQEVEAATVHPSQVDEHLSILLSMHNYLLGNTDYSVVKLHNVKLFRTSPASPYVAVPYDFDWTGLVSPPYAVPNPTLGISSVKQRLYRGFCYNEAMTAGVVTEFLAHQEEITALFQEQQHLSEKYQQKSLAYLGEFYETLSNEKQLERQILGACRDMP